MLNEVKKDVESLKARLIVQAKRKGISENFGRREIRALSDKHAKFLSDYCDSEACNGRMVISSLEEWAETYNGH